MISQDTINSLRVQPSQLEIIQNRAVQYKKTTDKYQSRLDQVLMAVDRLKQLTESRGLQFYSKGVQRNSGRSKKSTKYNIQCRIGTGELVPTITFRDSLNGESSTFIDFGIYRLVCSNGLHLSTGEFEFENKKHLGTWELNDARILEIFEIACKSLDQTVKKYEGKQSPDHIAIAKVKLLRNMAERAVITESQAKAAINYPIYMYDSRAGLFGLINTIQESLTTKRNKQKKLTEANMELNRKLIPEIEQALLEVYQLAA
jgi:hypothetical protein